MFGRVESLPGPPQLHDAPDVHYRHTVADVSNDAKIVRHEEIRQPELGLQILKQIQDLSLDRDIQGRDRLVGDHQAGSERPCAGNADALALPPAAGTRETPHVPGPGPAAPEATGHAVPR